MDGLTLDNGVLNQTRPYPVFGRAARAPSPEPLTSDVPPEVEETPILGPAESHDGEVAEPGAAIDSLIGDTLTDPDVQPTPLATEEPSPDADHVALRPVHSNGVATGTSRGADPGVGRRSAGRPLWRGGAGVGPDVEIPEQQISLSHRLKACPNSRSRSGAWLCDCGSMLFPATPKAARRRVSDPRSIPRT